VIASAGAGVRPVRRPLVLLVVLGALLVVVPACGKKGPPLPPLVNRPRAPEAVSARRLGGEVQIRFTVPRVNQSGVQPADVERVDVYALTGPKLEAARFLDHAAIVATVPVNPPPPPEGEQGTPRGAINPVAADQGTPVVVTEALTPQTLEPIDVPERDRRPRRAATFQVVVRRTELTPPDVSVPVTRAVLRHYSVVGITRGGRHGGMSPIVSVSLGEPPPPPAAPAAVVRERGIDVTWEPPRAIRGSMDSSESAAAPEAEAPDDDEKQPPAGAAAEKPAGPPPSAARTLRSRSFLPWPSVRSGFNLYAVPSAQADQAAGSPYSPSRFPQLLTPRPLTVPRFTDSAVQFGQERCYAVRTVETIGSTVIESAASPTTCVKVADVFPPAAPRSLAAVAAEQTINLIWEANTDADLAGYLVLRAAEGAAFEPQFNEPVRETTWRDTTVKPGVKYRYVVVAVDNASPRNKSTPSNEVEAFIR